MPRIASVRQNSSYQPFSFETDRQTDRHRAIWASYLIYMHRAVAYSPPTHGGVAYVERVKIVHQSFQCVLVETAAISIVCVSACLFMWTLRD